MIFYDILYVHMYTCYVYNIYKCYNVLLKIIFPMYREICMLLFKV